MRKGKVRESQQKNFLDGCRKMGQKVKNMNFCPFKNAVSLQKRGKTKGLSGGLQLALLNNLFSYY